MPEDQTELEHLPPVREVEIGEWFNPFTNYKNQPYLPEAERYGIKRKDFPFTVRGLGIFLTGLAWNQKFWQKMATDPGELSNKGIMIFLSHEEIISPKEFVKWVKQNNTKLLETGVVSWEEKYRDKAIPYEVELRCPSGRIFTGRHFIPQEPGFPPELTHWYDGKQLITPVIPEVENILEKIQMRIVPAS